MDSGDDGTGDNDALSICSGEASDSQAGNYTESDQDGSAQEDGHQEQDLHELSFMIK